MWWAGIHVSIHVNMYFNIYTNIMYIHIYRELQLYTYKYTKR